MRPCLSALLCALALACITTTSPAAASSSTTAERRILFVGNSLTYVNNLPAAFASLAPSDVKLSVDMIARPGAALEDYVGDAVFTAAIAHGRYTDVILQERGGNAVCGGECNALERTTLTLAKVIRGAGARVYYLGTWQALHAANQALETGERLVAKAIDAPYIEIGLARETLMKANPGLPWNHADGQHPGYATTALIALRVWRTVFGHRAQTIPCVGGMLDYHAPKPDGVLHVDVSAKPRTCLVSAEVAAQLESAP